MIKSNDYEIQKATIQCIMTTQPFRVVFFNIKTINSIIEWYIASIVFSPGIYMSFQVSTNNLSDKTLGLYNEMRTYLEC